MVPYYAVYLERVRICTYVSRYVLSRSVCHPKRWIEGTLLDVIKALIPHLSFLQKLNEQICKSMLKIANVFKVVREETY